MTITGLLLGIALAVGIIAFVYIETELSARRADKKYGKGNWYIR